MDNYTLLGLTHQIKVNLRGERNPMKKEKYKALLWGIKVGKVKTFDHAKKLFMVI